MATMIWSEELEALFTSLAGGRAEACVGKKPRKLFMAAAPYRLAQH